MAVKRKPSNVKTPKIAKERANKAVNGILEGDLSHAPYIDRFPRVVGSQLTLNEVSTIMRRCTMGDRQDYSLLLRELIERDASAWACVSQRILSVTSAEFTIRSAEYVEESEKQRAEEIANFVRRKLSQIHGFAKALQDLQWAVFYGLTCAEITWVEDHEGYVAPSHLNFVHNGRLNYPDQFDWTLYIIDRGAPSIGNKKYGVKVQDYPGKFIVHTPGLSADYPTRDGLGRELCIYMALKSMALRSGSQTIERFAKPWAIAYYNTKSEETKGHPRVATTNGANSDVAKAELALQALGTGAMTYATLPDSVELKPQENLTGSFTAELPQTIFMNFIDRQIARAVLTTDEFTIATGVGSQAKAEVLKRNLMQVLQYDAVNLAATLSRDLIEPLVLYNFPDELHLTPKLIMQVQDAPNLEQLVLAAAQAFELGAKINIQKLCDAWDIPLTDDPALIAEGRVDPNEELKAETQLEVSKQRAKQKPAAKPKKKVATKTKS